MFNRGFGRFTFLGSERYPNVGFHRFTISGSDRIHCPMHSDRIPSPGIRSIPIGIGRILEIPTLDPIVSHRIWSDPIVGFNDLGIPLRSIENTIHSPTTNISKFLDQLLRPIFDEKCKTTTIIDGTSLIEALDQYLKRRTFKSSVVSYLNLEFKVQVWHVCKFIISIYIHILVIHQYLLKSNFENFYKHIFLNRHLYHF